MIIFESDNGDFFKINRSTGEATFRHASGLVVSIDKEGNVTIDNTRAETGDYNVTIKGDVSITSDGDVIIEAAKGNIKLGGACATQPVNNLPACLVTGAPHSIGQQLPGAPGSTLVRP